MSEISPFNLLVGVTGSIAAIKIPNLLHDILQLNMEKPHLYNFKVRVMYSERALQFVSAESLSVGGAVQVYGDGDEWSAWAEARAGEAWRARDDAVLHVSLARWAHALLLAPLTANTLAKLAAGLADNLLTCAARAWHADRLRLYAPAMNTHMWLDPVTREHAATLAARGYEALPVASKTLACGDVGLGAMADPDLILARLRDLHPR